MWKSERPPLYRLLIPRGGSQHQAPTQLRELADLAAHAAANVPIWRKHGLPPRLLPASSASEGGDRAGARSRRFSPPGLADDPGLGSVRGGSPCFLPIAPLRASPSALVIPPLIRHHSPMFPALIVLVLAAAWRILSAYVTELGNFSPIMALAFCAGVYIRDRRLWAVPFAALVLSDLYLNHYYAVRFHYEYSLGEELPRIACFSAGLGLGFLVRRKRTWINLLSGTLGGSLLFYIVTNTAAFFADPFYLKTGAGWWQALTVGHPGFPPTLFFFRNTLVSDLVFTAAFATAMELSLLRRSEPSLLARQRG